MPSPETTDLPKLFCRGCYFVNKKHTAFECYKKKDKSIASRGLTYHLNKSHSCKTFYEAEGLLLTNRNGNFYGYDYRTSLQSYREPKAPERTHTSSQMGLISYKKRKSDSTNLHRLLNDHVLYNTLSQRLDRAIIDNERTAKKRKT